VLVISALFLCAASPPLCSAAIAAGDCEWAMARCVQDVLILGIASDYMINCMIGYIFCKKYIE
jgi:hypothetical protein